MHEQILAEIWCEVLGLERVGMHSNFFDLGGHSLTSTLLIARIRDLFGIQLPLSRVFDLPTVEGLAELLSVVSQSTALTGQSVEGSGSKDQEPHGPFSYGLYPMSYNQKALWFMCKLNDSNKHFNVNFAGEVKGCLNVDALRWVLARMTHRHLVLKTTYHDEDSGPCQRVHKDMPFDLKVVSTPASSVQSTLESLSEEVTDLSRGPILRVRVITDLAIAGSAGPQQLLSSESGRIVLLFSTHHIAMDLWSMVLLVQELSSLYQFACQQQLTEESACDDALKEKMEPPLRRLLEPDTLQYVDYAVWQHPYLQSAEGERLWSYWQRNLSGTIPNLNLFTDQPRPPVQTYRGCSFSFRVGQPLTQGLCQLARKEGLSMFALLLAAYQVLLFHYTGFQEEIFVGTPMAGRTQSQFQTIVGDFVNIVVLFANFSDVPSFRDLLGQTRDNVLQALMHQEFPFPLIIEKLQSHRDISRPPLCQTLFSMQKPHKYNSLTPFVLGEAGGTFQLSDNFSLQSVELNEHVSQYDLSLLTAEVDSELACCFHYNVDLFLPRTISRLASHFTNLLQHASSSPDIKVSELSLASEEELDIVVVQWNQTEPELVSMGKHCL